MTEVRLGRLLTVRIGRLLWYTLASFAALVIVVFVAMSELGLRRSLDHNGEVIESLLGLYADPGGERTTVAPVMLADQLLGMGARFLITRSVTIGGDRTVYFLSPTMPAKEVQPPADATAEEVREHIVRIIAERGRWRYRVLHRRAGEFDVFVAGSRGPYAITALGLAAAALLLLPLAAVAARQATRREVMAALVPFARVVGETKEIGPSDLTRRVSAPTGVVEVTELADEINRLIERVEQAQRALEAFTADVSHELRTPLTHLRAQTQWALADGRDPDEIREALSAISREVEQTTKTVEDLLLIARGDNRQLQLASQRFDLAGVVREVEEVTQAMAAGRELTVPAGVNEPVEALGDPNRTRQILLNLASNAVRYTETGSVRFELVSDEEMVGVAVRDTGCGIAIEHQGRIFDRFYRTEQSRSRAHGGAGLGLTIAQLLAGLQGGRVTMESEPDKGSTFVLWLPAG